MKKSDQYHRWGEYSEEDEIYLGKCPDLFDGGVHDADPVKCAKRLQWAVDDCAGDYEKEGNWPPVRTRPMMEPV